MCSSVTINFITVFKNFENNILTLGKAHLKKKRPYLALRANRGGGGLPKYQPP